MKYVLLALISFSLIACAHPHRHHKKGKKHRHIKVVVEVNHEASSTTQASIVALTPRARTV